MIYIGILLYILYIYNNIYNIYNNIPIYYIYIIKKC